MFVSKLGVGGGGGGAVNRAGKTGVSQNSMGQIETSDHLVD